MKRTTIILSLLVVGALLLAAGGVSNFDGVHLLGNLAFEGATQDGFETTVTVVDPTAARTITLPNSSGTVALNPYGASIEFEGATANDFETTLTVVDPTADRTVTLQDATGTVALTSQAVDMTLTADATGGNAGAKTEYIGLPRIRLIGGGQGTNPGGQTIVLADDSPEGEFAPVDASVVEAAEAAIYRVGAGSYKMTWAVDAAENDGVIDAALFGGASLEDQESIGLWLYSSVALAAGDLQIAIVDDGGTRTFNIPAVATANQWTWVEVDISTLDAGTGDVCSDFAISMTAQGAAAAGLNAEWVLYFDTGYAWDAVDEEALGVDIFYDGVLGVTNTETGAALVEYTNYFVHYQTGTDAIVYIDDQSAADIVILAAY